MKSLTRVLFCKESLAMCRQITHVLHKLVAPICKEKRLTPQQLFILNELCLKPDQTAGQLCERAGILRTNFAMVCRKMEEQGLIEKNQSSIDRRSFTLRLTQQGQDALDEIDGCLHNTIVGLTKDVPEQALADIATGLAAVPTLIAHLSSVDEGVKHEGRLLSRKARARQRGEDC